MGILREAIERRSVSVTSPPQWLLDYLNVSSYSGESVSPEKALAVSGWYACVTILAETVGSLPLILYRKTDKGKERASDNPLFYLMHDKPNSEHSSMTFRELLQGHMGGWGNGYAQIIRNGRGEVMEVWPLRPDRMKVERKNGKKFYTYRENGIDDRPFVNDEMLHVMSFSLDGLVGLSPVAMARNALGVSIAAEKYGGKMFANDARPSVVLKHPGVLGKTGEERSDAVNRLKAQWSDTYGGANNAGKTAVLEEGMGIETIGFPPEQAQFLETRKFQIADIARWFKMPLSLLGEHDKASTYASVEQFMLSFVTHTVRPWLVRWEQALNSQLLTEAERRGGFYFEFLVDALLRGDTAARFEAYSKGIQNGFFSINDVRQRENMDTVNGGEEHFIPLNLVPLEQSGQLDDSPDQGARAIEQRNTKDEKEERKNQRQEVAARRRHRLANAQRAAIEDVAARILRRERNDILSALKKQRNGSEIAFQSWLDQFYNEHAEWASEQMYPTMRTYGQVINDAVAEELGMEGEDLPEEAVHFIKAFVRAYGLRHALRSRAWMAEWLENSWAMPEDEFDSGVTNFFDNWMAERPGRIALEESVRGGNAIAKTLYVLAGVIQIRSIAFGENCPYCDALNGQVIGVEQYYLHPGEDFQPDGADAPLTVNEKCSHAPYHNGCDCVNVAEI